MICAVLETLLPADEFNVSGAWAQSMRSGSLIAPDLSDGPR